MADVTISGSPKAPATGAAGVRYAEAGAAITAGQAIYLDSTDGNTAKPADANLSSAAAAAVGVSLTGAADGEQVAYVVSGDFELGGTLVKGTTYILSATAGGIAPDSDAVSGWYKTILGVASSTTNLTLSVNATGITV